jgi:hypothetical protein
VKETPPRQHGRPAVSSSCLLLRQQAPRQDRSSRPSGRYPPVASQSGQIPMKKAGLVVNERGKPSAKSSERGPAWFWPISNGLSRSVVQQSAVGCAETHTPVRPSTAMESVEVRTEMIAA